MSRSGATLTAARARGFSRADAQRLSADAALPVLLGAGALECLRLARDGAPAGMRGAMAAGAAASALSSALSARAAADPSCASIPLAPFAAYRLALAGAVLARAQVGAMTESGTLLGGRYRLDAQIGRGGMSTV